MHDQKRSVDRAPQRLAIFEAALTELGPNAMGEISADFRTSADDADLATLVARQRLRDPPAEDSIASEDCDDSR
jgi:hypothetical protein